LRQRPSETAKGISAARRERIEAAVEAGGSHVARPYDGWIAADPFPGAASGFSSPGRRASEGRSRSARRLDVAPKRIARSAARRRMTAAQKKRWAARKAKAAAAGAPAVAE
jgi:hypothetical protein